MTEDTEEESGESGIHNTTIPASRFQHDTLISNPEYREIYNEAIEEGMSPDEAHDYARAELSAESNEDGDDSYE